MLQEVSFHPGERRRVKSTLKKIGPEYWCVMEASQRIRAGQEERKAGVSTANYKAPWVFSVVTFLHKDVFKRPIRVDWAGQYTRKTMKHMLLGRMFCLWAPRHSESLMLVVNIHHDDPSFIVLTETKFSFRCIPVWDRYSPHRTRVEKKNTCDNAGRVSNCRLTTTRVGGAAKPCELDTRKRKVLLVGIFQRECIRKSRRVLQRKRDSHEESRRPISSMRCCNEGNTNFPVDTVLDRCQHGQRSKT